jgi:hypothetical protein
MYDEEAARLRKKDFWEKAAVAALGGAMASDRQSGSSPEIASQMADRLVELWAKRWEKPPQ